MVSFQWIPYFTLLVVTSLSFTLFHPVVSIDFDSLKYDITEGDLGELSIFLNRTSQTNISFIVMLMDGTAGKCKLVYMVSKTDSSNVLCCLLF